MRLVSLDMVPLRIRNFRLNDADDKDVLWMKEVLNREGKKFGTSVGGTRVFSLVFTIAQ